MASWAAAKAFWIMPTCGPLPWVMMISLPCSMSPKGRGGVVDLLDLLGGSVAKGVATKSHDNAVGLAVRLGHNCLFSNVGRRF